MSQDDYVIFVQTSIPFAANSPLNNAVEYAAFFKFLFTAFITDSLW